MENGITLQILLRHIFSSMPGEFVNRFMKALGTQQIENNVMDYYHQNHRYS